MPIPSYTPGYPPDGSSLGETKATIRNNLDGTFQVFSVDHLNQNQAKAGFHNLIHVNPQLSNPAPTGGVGQIYTRQVNSVNTDEALFYQSGGGRIAQLTMNIAPSVTSAGYSYLPGGILIQWNRVDTNASSGRVTYPLQFPNNVWSIQTTAKFSSGSGLPGSQANYAPDENTAAGPNQFNTAGFSWNLITNSSSWRGFFWIAIGN